MQLPLLPCFLGLQEEAHIARSERHFGHDQDQAWINFFACFCQGQTSGQSYASCAKQHANNDSLSTKQKVVDVDRLTLTVLSGFSVTDRFA